MFQKSNIEQYFDAEKTEATVFFCIGVLACVAALVVGLIYKTKWSLGLAIPLVLLAIIQIAVGISVYRKSDKMRTDAVYAYDLDPAFLKNQEIPRMQKVMVNFRYYKIAEIACLLLGAALILFVSKQSSAALWNGLGWGLAAQAGILLVLDFFAEKRGQEYLDGLVKWLQR